MNFLWINTLGAVSYYHSPIEQNRHLAPDGIGWYNFHCSDSAVRLGDDISLQQQGRLKVCVKSGVGRKTSLKIWLFL